MPKSTRKIPRQPKTTIHYLVDSNFLINRYLDKDSITNGEEKGRVIKSQQYWEVIDTQLKSHLCKIFILDLCIAESFKVLAKKYYKERVFRSHRQYSKTLERLRRDIHLSSKEAKKKSRKISFHDIQTNRDIIISVDRYFELINRASGLGNVSIVDLLILATGKYLMDFYGFTKNDLFIVTQDGPLYKLARKDNNLPNTFNPLMKIDLVDKVFV